MRFKRQRVALVAAATVGLLIAAAGVTAIVAHAAVGCQVTYGVSSSWPGGFTGTITVRNLGDPLTSWQLRFSFAAGQTITQTWNGTHSQSGGNVTISNVSYNGNLGTNGTVQPGFNATWTSSNPAPTSFSLNNVACTGSVSGPTTTQPPPTDPTTAPPPQGQQCGAFATITMGKYWLNNNLWGQSSGSGSQCMWANSTSGSTISWGTSWNWSGQSNQVKSYTSSVLGWHWGWMLSNHLWLHTISNPTYENQPTDEVMIWPYRAGGAGPAGTLQATVSIGGSSWELYRGVVGSWNVFSFVLTSNTGSVNLNLRDFLNNLVSRGWLQSSKYLTSVQAGTEVFIGNGRLDTTAYSVTIS
jgi:hypothetical protein